MTGLNDNNSYYVIAVDLLMLLGAEMKFHPANGDQTWWWSFLRSAGRGVCFRFSISPLMFLFCVTNLTLYASICWFCTVTTAHPLVFILSSFLLLFLLVVLFFSCISMSCILWKLSVGWPNFMFDWCCMFNYCVSFVCFCACCSKNSWNTKKRNCHWMCHQISSS